MAIKKTFRSVDGNTAAAIGSYYFTEVACIYPITPSSPMAELVDVYASQGQKNVFDATVKVVEMQSEGGAAGAVHGALQAGALATTYTASQGLLLMIPNLYKWAGELLPAVLHVAARSVASRSLSIFGDHSDVYACRQTGVAMLCSHSVQDVADLAPIAHLIAIESQTPMLHFFDGFRTSHEIQNVEFIDGDEYRKLLPPEAVEAFRRRALDPHGHAVTRGGAENDDICFQAREAQNAHYAKVVDIAAKYLQEASRLSGRSYAPFVYEGAPDAEDVIIAMGSVTETIGEVVRALNKKGARVGLLKVYLYRPFSAACLSAALPVSVRRLAVLDRTKEIGAAGEPLYLDVVAALKQTNRSDIAVYGGRYGLSSKDTEPKHIKSVYDFLRARPFHDFTIGINDDVTHRSIPIDEDFQIPNYYTACLFYGLGSDGTVSANKSSIKIIGEATGQYAQAYFQYDSRKSGGVTRSHLRFGHEMIHSTYYVHNADFLSCSLDTYIYKFDLLKDLKDGGTFLLNTDMPDDVLISSLPDRMKYQLAKKHAKFYVIDANRIAHEIGMGRHTNTTLQASFFFLNPGIMPYEDARTWMKKLALKTYGRKGQAVVDLNYKAIDAGASGLRRIEVDPAWLTLSPKRILAKTGDDYFDSYVNVIGMLDGETLPVSKFTEFELLDGTMRNNITFHEKRCTADLVPMWHKENCIQCNQCAFVCPHATIRPFLLTDEEVAQAPAIVKDGVIPASGGPALKGLKFRVQISPKNCVGCGLCISECLVNKAHPDDKSKWALTVSEAKAQYPEEEGADYLYKKVPYKRGLVSTDTVKGVGFLMPYMESPGSCAGCGETPYYRLVSQLFGRDMLIANATGCSSIYCGSTPLTPFVKDRNGEGIAWANSLFEDNAEYGYGMRMAVDHRFVHVLKILKEALARDSVEAELKSVINDYLAHLKDREYARKVIPELLRLIKASADEGIKAVLAHEKDLLDPSIWIIGGDGWSYDIGFGGLDHVMASDADVNVMILDTEVYSNTGGQSSKSSQTGSIAKFTASGKTGVKKNMPLMAMAYGHVYVAQIALGANPLQAIKALKEAESYDGPSLIICYSPCISHGLHGGLVNSMRAEKAAVECGYFPTFRYDPRRVARGEPGLVIDGKEPDFTKFRAFLLNETRYAMLPVVNPKHAEELFQRAEASAKERWERIKKFGL